MNPTGRSKFNINMVANLNKPVSDGQRSLFKQMTGHELPYDVTTFGGANRAIDQAKEWGKTNCPMGEMVLREDCFTDQWDNKSRQPVSVKSVGKGQYTLAAFTKAPTAVSVTSTSVSPAPQPAGVAPGSINAITGGTMTPNIISVPAHSGVVEQAKPAATVATPSPKAPKAPKTPEKWKLIGNESIVGFTPHSDIERLVPKAGPTGLPMVDNKEIKFVVRECDEEYWYALKSEKKVIAAGKSGCGKDMSALMFAFKNGLPLKVFPFTGSARIEDLFGHRDLKAVNGVTESPYILHDDAKVLRYGGLEVLGEVNGGGANELIGLNQQLEAREAIIQKTGETFAYHEHAYVTANFNPGYEGTKALNAAFKGRFAIVEFPAWTKDELYRLMGPIKEFDKLAELYLKIQKAMDDPKNTLRGGIISIRNLMQIQRMLNDEMSIDRALHIGLLSAFKCDTKDGANYQAAFALAQGIFGSALTLRK